MRSCSLAGMVPSSTKRTVSLSLELGPPDPKAARRAASRDPCPPPPLTLQLLPEPVTTASYPSVLPSQGYSSASAEPPELPPPDDAAPEPSPRSEEHTSELQSRENLVCRLLL